jgi:hypothetical protein
MRRLTKHLGMVMEDKMYDRLVDLAEECGWHYGDNPHVSKAARLAILIGLEVLDSSRDEQQSDSEDKAPETAYDER